MKDAYYFKHDSNAKDDPKCVLLIETLQLEGYGIFWVLIETLRDQPGYKYPIALLPAIARRYNSTIEKVKAVVYNFGLFEVDDDNFFYSDSLNRRMIAWDENKQKYIKAGKASGRARKQKAIEHQSNDVQTSLELLDKNTLDKNKKDNTKSPARTTFRPPAVLDVTKYCDERKNGIDPEHFVDHYISNGWMVGKNKMKDWKGCVRTWEKNSFKNGTKNTELPDCGPQESTVPKWIKEEGVTFE